LHFCLLGGIFAIKILTATKEFFLDVLFIFEFLTQGIILSIESLLLDVKPEFNSDNKRMYSNKDGAIILYEGEIK